MSISSLEEILIFGNFYGVKSMRVEIKCEYISKFLFVVETSNDKEFSLVFLDICSIILTVKIKIRSLRIDSRMFVSRFRSKTFSHYF